MDVYGAADVYDTNLRHLQNEDDFGLADEFIATADDPVINPREGVRIRFGTFGGVPAVEKTVSGEIFNIGKNRPARDRPGAVEFNEDASTEIGVLREMAQDPNRHLVVLLGVFFTPDAVRIITRRCLCDVFALIVSRNIRQHAERFTRQLLAGLRHMHRLNIAHRDLSLENVLVEEIANGLYQVVLIDFGQACLCRSVAGALFRYFANISKLYCCPPEVINLPPVDGVWVETNLDPGLRVLHPERDVVYRHRTELEKFPQYEVEVPQPQDANQVEGLCLARVAGYKATFADMYCLGVVSYTMHMRKYPWENARYNEKSRSWRVFRAESERERFQRFQDLNISVPVSQLLASVLDPIPENRNDPDYYLNT